MHPATAEILTYFTHEHLPDDLSRVSAPICELAQALAGLGLSGPEVDTGLRKLLEAKDCFVRAAVSARGEG